MNGRTASTESDPETPDRTPHRLVLPDAGGSGWLGLETEPSARGYRGRPPAAGDFCSRRIRRDAGSRPGARGGCSLAKVPASRSAKRLGLRPLSAASGRCRSGVSFLRRFARAGLAPPTVAGPRAVVPGDVRLKSGRSRTPNPRVGPPAYGRPRQGCRPGPARSRRDGHRSPAGSPRTPLGLKHRERNLKDRER